MTKFGDSAPKEKGIRRVHLRRPSGASYIYRDRKGNDKEKTGDMNPVPIKLKRIQ